MRPPSWTRGDDDRDRLAIALATFIAIAAVAAALSSVGTAIAEDPIPVAATDAVEPVAEVTTTTLASIPPSVRLIDEGGRVTITGAVPTDAQANDIVAAAWGAFGADNVRDLLVVGDQVEDAEWIEAIPAVVAAVADLEGFDLEVHGTGGVLEGSVVRQGDLEAVRRAFSDLGVEVEGEVTVIELAIDVAVLFEFESATVTPAGAALLDEVARILGEAPTSRVLVAGHADAIGSTGFNQQLSEDRAAAVVDYLVGAGIDPVRLSFVGFGESEPVADNTSEEGRAANRRVEFTISE